MNFQRRVKALQKLLKELKVDALIVENLINIYYLTGIEMSAGRVLISKNDASLIVDGRYYEKCKMESPISVLLSKESTFKDLLAKEKVKKLGFDSETTTHMGFVGLEQAYPKIALVPCNNPIRKMRAIKDKEELKLMREAARLGSEGFNHIVGMLKVGITEEEVAQELEIFWKKRKGKKVAFDPIIAFGKNTSMPHYHSENVKLKKGDPVLIDIGVVLNHYNSDMTRTLFFGKPDPKMKKIYEIVKEAQQLALDGCKPGVTTGAVDHIARSYIKEKGYGEYFVHSLGHGVGLEIHEEPTLRSMSPDEEVLEAGMVVTIEPGIYLPGVGGVRIEDTVIITGKGYENLSKVPKELQVLL